MKEMAKESQGDSIIVCSNYQWALNCFFRRNCHLVSACFVLITLLKSEEMSDNNSLVENRVSSLLKVLTRTERLRTQNRLDVQDVSQMKKTIVFYVFL
jgi:hypothetical protein